MATTKKKATRKKAAKKAAPTGAMRVTTYTASTLTFPNTARNAKQPPTFNGDWVDRIDGRLILVDDGRVIYRAGCGSFYQLASGKAEIQTLIGFLQSCL